MEVCSGNGGFLPSRKKAFSVCALLLAITFTIVVLDGRQQKTSYMLRTRIRQRPGYLSQDTSKTWDLLRYEPPDYAELKPKFREETIFERITTVHNENSVKTLDTVSAQDGSDPVNDTCDKCCYRYTTIGRGIIEEFNESQLRQRNCTKRLPDAIVFGVKKGGTTTLKNFISYHPDIAFTQKEIKFFTSSTERMKGLEYYRSQMTYSTTSQVSMEKTPAYYHYPRVPALIKKALPNVKLIIIMRDPIQRAISDYVHMLVTIFNQCKASGNHPVLSTLENITLPKDCHYKISYVIKDTFEKSVLDGRGNILRNSQLISKGVYIKDIKAYLRYFSLDQILALDGEAFIHDPYPAVKKVERFLGIRDYFRRDHFYFDAQKGFFCLDKPVPRNCMNPSKGRPHPEVREETLRKLRDFYRPYNAALKKLLNLDINWSS